MLEDHLIIIKMALRDTDCNRSDNSSHDPWDSVKVMNTTGIMQSNLLLEERTELHETKCADNASNCSDDKGSCWGGEQVTT